VLIHWRN